MLQRRTRITALVAACFVYSSMSAPTGAVTSSNPVLTSDVMATVSAHRGVVFKRDFLDFRKQTYGEPLPVADQDKLHEGMQVGTGNDSWAEVQWPNVRTRAWANTVFAVAPNKRLVYLTGGEMLFRLDKNRPDKDPYYIWTKVLQARIRGTTVLVQAKNNTTRFTVIEGVVDLWNRLDHSHITLNPGAVYEIKGFDLSKQTPLPDVNSKTSTADPCATRPDITGGVTTYSPHPLSLGNIDDKSVRDVTSGQQTYIPLFQDNYAQTNVYASNKQALLDHPLVKDVNGQIDSMDLILKAQKDMPSFNQVIPLPFSDSAQAEKIALKNVQVKGVPTNADYCVGKAFSGKLAQMSFLDMRPKGVVFNPYQTTPQESSANTPTAHLPVPPTTAMWVGVPIVPPITGKTVVLDEEATPTQDNSQTSNATVQPQPESRSAVPPVVPEVCQTAPSKVEGTTTQAFTSSAGLTAPMGTASAGGSIRGTAASAFPTMRTPQERLPAADSDKSTK